jgi:hypothetical protein
LIHTLVLGNPTQDYGSRSRLEVDRVWKSIAAGLGVAPTFFTLAMVLAYSVTLGVAYSLLQPKSA